MQTILTRLEKFCKLFDASRRLFQPTFVEMGGVVTGYGRVRRRGGVAFLFQCLRKRFDLCVRFREVVDEHESGENEELVFGNVADIVFHFAQSFVEVFARVLQVDFLSLLADDSTP